MSLLVQTLLVILAVVAASTYLLRRGWKFVRLFRVGGGGEGRAKGRHPVTPWGKPAKGYKTRAPKKQSNKYIIEKRKK